MVTWFMVGCGWLVCFVLWGLVCLVLVFYFFVFGWLLFDCVCCLLLVVACYRGLLVNSVDSVVSLLLLFFVFVMFDMCMANVGLVVAMFAVVWD